MKGELGSLFEAKMELELTKVNSYGFGFLFSSIFLSSQISLKRQEISFGLTMIERI